MIVEFYENCEVFITGGSGVVGKAAIEKLLRSCNVKKIYVLLRCKKGVNPEDRLKDMKYSKIFRVLKECKPNELDKLVAIPGDTALDGLGISPEHKELIKNVSVFIHSAATTRFNEPIKTAIRLNVKATLEALKLAETMKNLSIFLHVSTFFSNPYLKYVQDKVHPTVFDWRTAIKMLDNDEIDPVLDTITEKIIKGFPNTYSFTKHLAEKLVDDHRFKLPVAIYKPSIVITAFEEPEPGFTETMTGIMAMMVVWGTGLVQALYMENMKMKMDMTPLDFGTKTLLIFTALKAQLPKEKFIEATPVGKFSSTQILDTPFLEQCNTLTEGVYKTPLEKSIWIPNVTITSSKLLYWTIVFFQQVLPALLVDGLLILFRKKPFMMQIQRKIVLTTQVLMFFLTYEYTSDGITDFDEMVTAAEGSEFCLKTISDHCESKDLMHTAILNIAAGCRKFVLNEPDSSIERCKRILRAKIVVYNILRFFVAYVVVRAVYRMVMAYVQQCI